jgi:hypothetical protein
VANFCHFANFGREKRLELSNCNFGNANIFPCYYCIYILYHVFLSSVVDMVGKVCSGIKAQVVIGKDLAYVSH